MKKVLTVLLIIAVIIAIVVAGLLYINSQKKAPAISGDAGVEGQTASETLKSAKSKEEDSTGFLDEQTIIDIYRSYALPDDMSGIGKEDKVIGELVTLYGKNDFTSIDSDNQVDMVNREYLDEFIGHVNNNETASQTVISVDSPTRIIRYGLETADGEVTVHKTWYDFAEDDVKLVDNITFTADPFTVGERYLMFSGSYHSELLYALVLGDGMDHNALRMATTDPECIKLSQLDVLKIGYAENNIFSSDWSTKDYSQLDTDDVFAYIDRRYGNKLFTYDYDIDESNNRIYHVPGNVYEGAVTSIIDISAEELRRKDSYHPETESYDYRQRNSDEVATPDYPVMEVLSYEEDGDDLILKVNAVYKEMNAESAMTSEVRLKKEGDTYKVSSNRVLNKEDDNFIWYVERKDHT